MSPLCHLSSFSSPPWKFEQHVPLGHLKKDDKEADRMAGNGEMFQMRRAGTRQNGDIPGVTPFLVNLETHSSTFWFYRPRLFCPSVKQRSYQTALKQCLGPRSWAMFQSNKWCYRPHWKLILALRSSILFSKDWTLVSRILSRGGLWALSLSRAKIVNKSTIWAELPERWPNTAAPWCERIKI